MWRWHLRVNWHRYASATGGGSLTDRGATVVPPQFNLAYACADGRARIVVAGFAGFIDEFGEEMLLRE